MKNGKHLRTIGSPGEKPGQFLGNGGLAVYSNTLLAADTLGARIAAFTLQGAFITEFQIVVEAALFSSQTPVRAWQQIQAPTQTPASDTAATATTPPATTTTSARPADTRVMKPMDIAVDCEGLIYISVLDSDLHGNRGCGARIFVCAFDHAD